MKKLFGLLSLLVYIVSTNALVHAQSMGILPSHETMTMWSCHGHHENVPSSKQNVDCCELVYSNQYTHTQIQPEYIQHLFALVPQLSNFTNIVTLQTDIRHILLSNFSPWRNPDIKYQKFSDLTGSIVNIA